MPEDKGETIRVSDNLIAQVNKAETSELAISIARNLLTQDDSVSSEQRWQILEWVRLKDIPKTWGGEKRALGDYKKLATRVDLEELGKFAARFIKDDDQSGIELIKNFQEEIVPKVKYDLGSYDTIQASFKKARLQQKNALWTALKFKDAKLFEKLLKNLDPSVNNKPAFSFVISMSPRIKDRKEYLQSNYPQYQYYETPDLDFEQLSPHARGLHLRQIKHYLSVYGRAGKPVLIDGLNLSKTLREDIIEFARSLGAHITLLFFESSLDKLIEKEEDGEMIELIRNSYHQLSHPHPWEAHKIEVIDW